MVKKYLNPKMEVMDLGAEEMLAESLGINTDDTVIITNSDDIETKESWSKSVWEKW